METCPTPLPTWLGTLVVVIVIVVVVASRGRPLVVGGCPIITGGLPVFAVPLCDLDGERALQGYGDLVVLLILEQAERSGVDFVNQLRRKISGNFFSLKQDLKNEF
jgi:hypothetical protein